MHDKRTPRVVPADRHGESEGEQQTDEPEQRPLHDAHRLVADIRPVSQPTPDDGPDRDGASDDDAQREGDRQRVQAEEHRSHSRSPRRVAPRSAALGEACALEVPYQEDLARHMLLRALVASATGYLASERAIGKGMVLSACAEHFVEGVDENVVVGIADVAVTA